MTHSLPQVEVHPFAMLFPAMPAEDWPGFVADIRTHGVHEPIMLYQGKVLDGRHRCKAVHELHRDHGFEIALSFNEFTGNDEQALAYIMSVNLHRRHLTTGQKALIASELQETMQSTVKAGNPALQASDVSNPNSGKFAGIGGKDTRDAAGKALGVSGKSVDAARKLQHESPELADEVRSGSMSLNAAVTESKEPLTRAIRLLCRYLENHAKDIPLPAMPGYRLAINVLEKQAGKDTTP